MPSIGGVGLEIFSWQLEWEWFLSDVLKIRWTLSICSKICAKRVFR